jgi:Tol biopolymer transport system component/tRNA A-37 threonylcarbamoyl transferase component Bud32
MTPERWNRVSELFEAALEREPRERGSFLTEACSDDRELLAEVESLLAEHGRAGGFLDGPASGKAASALRQAWRDGSESAEADPYLGVTLGNRYRIESRLARGGQALVYRARDTVVMSKPVVVKILHAAAGQNAWLRKKFRQEMEALSRIDHPGIVGVLDTGELPGGTPYLVVQYVEGMTLRKALECGPFAPVRAAAILRQIGAGLEAAHATGIAHRDLKPENIMLQRLSDGTELVKLIDFGIAKVEKSALGSNTTTVMVAGTSRYMAPEQFQGENSSASDIYALGLIVCEMLTGLPDLYALEAPRTVRELVRAALAYRPEERPQRAGEFCGRLAKALTDAPKEKAAAPVLVLPGTRLAWIVTALLLANLAAAAWLYSRKRSFETRTVVLSLAPPEGTTLGPFAVSPDGSRIAFTATDFSGATQLWVRPLGSPAAQPLAGTEGANSPFWSADSRFLGFFAGGKLKKIEASGGPPQVICNAETGARGGAWNRGGIILFAPNPATPLYQVSAAGGEAAPVTTLDAANGDSSHGWPQFLPDGRHFLYFGQSGRPEASGIYVASLDSTEKKRILSAGSSALYASGHLLFLRDHVLMAQPFDTTRLQLAGDALPIAENVGAASTSSRSLFSVSDDGTLAHASGTPAGSTQLLWFDRTGRPLGSVSSTSGGQTVYSNLNLSPDGSRIAVDRRDPQTEARDVWTFDLARGSESRLTFHPATDGSPVWSPDGSRVIFFSSRDGVWNLYQKAATGTGDDKLLLKSGESKIACDWSHDGRYILYREWDPRTKWDLWVLSSGGRQETEPIVQTPLEEGCGQISPDGRWLAYVSGETGREEVYVQPFAPGSQDAGRWQISIDGGAVPRWRRDGKELFYLSRDRKLMAVAVTGGATFQAGAPRPLFQTRATGFLRYDVAAGGRRFLVNTAVEEPASSLPAIVLNWAARLKR